MKRLAIVEYLNLSCEIYLIDRELLCVHIYIFASPNSLQIMI